VALTGRREHNAREYDHLLRAASLAITDIVPTQSQWSVIDRKRRPLPYTKASRHRERRISAALQHRIRADAAPCRQDPNILNVGISVAAFPIDECGAAHCWPLGRIVGTDGGRCGLGWRFAQPLVRAKGRTRRCSTTASRDLHAFTPEIPPLRQTRPVNSDRCAAQLV
jgi:hypothetical protein